MGSEGHLLMLLLLLLVLSQDHNKQMAFILKRHAWTCPQIKAHCLYREVSVCSSDKDCKAHEKCCLYSCGMKCLDSTEDPCEEAIKTRSCPHTLTRWHYDIKEKECFPIEYSTCTDSKNNFQSRDVCKRTCLKFGHGVPVKLFELDGEPFTALI